MLHNSENKNIVQLLVTLDFSPTLTYIPYSLETTVSPE